MEIQDYTSLVKALNVVDALLESDVKKSVYIAEDKKQPVFEQICAYLSKTFTPLLQHSAFSGHNFYNYYGVRISINKYVVNGLCNGVRVCNLDLRDRDSVQFWHGAIGTGESAKCYFLYDGRVLVDGDFNTIKIADIVRRWPEIKSTITRSVSQITKCYADEAKKKSEEEARLAESLVNFQV